VAKGAVAARKAAKQAEKRAQRIVAGDSRVREILDFPILIALQDWTLIVCEGCGIEQGSKRGPCACGSDTAVYADAGRAEESKLELRRFAA
jgi:hypothetical protein